MSLLFILLTTWSHLHFCFLPAVTCTTICSTDPSLRIFQGFHVCRDCKTHFYSSFFGFFKTWKRTKDKKVLSWIFQVSAKQQLKRGDSSDMGEDQLFCRGETYLVRHVIFTNCRRTMLFKQDLKKKKIWLKTCRDLRHNLFSNVSSVLNPPSNVTVK